MFTNTITSGKRNLVTLAVLFLMLVSTVAANAATITLPAKGNPTIYYWSLIQSGSYAGISPIASTDNVILEKKCWLIIDVTNAVCNQLDLGSTGGTGADWATLEIQNGKKLTVASLVVSNVSASKSADIIFGAGTGSPATGGGELVCAGFTGPNFDFQPNGGQITIKGTTNLPANLTAFNDLTIDLPNATDSLLLTVDIAVNGKLSLIKGRLSLKSFNLTMGSTSSISSTYPGSNNSYVRISGSGRYKASVKRSTSYKFPVGFNPYLPITITLPASAPATTDFTIGVKSGVVNSSNVAITSHAVNSTWEITPAVAINGVTMTIGWVTAQNLTGYNATNSFMLLRQGTGVWASLSGSTSANVSGTSDGISDFIQTSPSFNFPLGNTMYSAGIGDGLSNFGTIVPLPVDLISFTVNKMNDVQAKLDWSTAWEINNRGFEVERSTNGVYWTNIGFVAGNGNSNQILNYSFPTSLAGINSSLVYYRLKQVDFNGKFEYSPVRTVRLSGAVAKVEGIYPNPAMNRISISLASVEAGQLAKITILDMTGKVIMTSEQMVEGGNTALDMNIDNLKKGNYIVNVSSANTNYNTKLIKL